MSATKPKPFDMSKAAGTLAKRLAEAQPGEKILDLPLSKVIPNPKQHRKHFDPDKLRQLADSIVATGQELPIVVRPNETDGEPPYIIISGERRWRACGIGKLATVKAVIRQIGADESDRILLSEAAENWQRESLTISESIALAVDVVGRFGLQIASEKTGKPKTLLSKMTTIGKAPAIVSECVNAGMVEDVETLHRLASLAKESEAEAVRLVGLWRSDETQLVGVRNQIDAARKKIADRNKPPAESTTPPGAKTGTTPASSTDSAEDSPDLRPHPKAAKGQTEEPSTVGNSSATHIVGGSSVEPASPVVPPVATGAVETVRTAARSQRSESEEGLRTPPSTPSESTDATGPLLVVVSADFHPAVVVLNTKTGPIRFDRAALVSVLGLDV